MPDARILREITDALRALKDRADQAGSPTVRAILTMTAEAVHREAEKAEREASTRAVRPSEMLRKLGEG